MDLKSGEEGNKGREVDDVLSILSLPLFGFVFGPAIHHPNEA